jgi:hypothetical protein
LFLVDAFNDKLQTEFGESIDIGHLLRASVIFKELKVLVISDSSVMWCMVCIQVGIGDISISSLSEKATNNYSCLNREKLSLLDNVRLIE